MFISVSVFNKGVPPAFSTKSPFYDEKLQKTKKSSSLNCKKNSIFVFRSKYYVKFVLRKNRVSREDLLCFRFRGYTKNGETC